MKCTLYDLAAADPDLRFSPYCWRTKLALAHKGLQVETIPWRFTDKDVIAFSNQGKVPVLVDDGKTITDSQAIAEYLETAYPNEASLFGDAASRALTLFVKNWTEDVLHPSIVNFLLPDIFPQLDPKDQPYFRKSREAFYGKSIETFAAERDVHLPAFQVALAPLRRTLATQPFIAGNTPAYADHIVFGALQWASKMSRTKLLEPDEVISLWMHALLASYGLEG